MLNIHTVLKFPDLVANFRMSNSSFSATMIWCLNAKRGIIQGKQPFFVYVGLFCGKLFSGFGRCLLWEIDNVVEFVQLCHYFMVNERFHNDIFRASFPPNYSYSFLENQFCEVLFTLKLSGYLCLARNLIDYASREFEEIFILDDLVAASTAFNFQRMVERRYSELEGN